MPPSPKVFSMNHAACEVASILSFPLYREPKFQLYLPIIWNLHISTPIPTPTPYSILATPAEGLSGRFTKIDQKKYGIIPGVNDRDYYVNSFHVDVKEPITIVEKIKCEAPFHALTRGGHITYVELDGEAKKNIKAIAKIVKVMHDEGIGYGSINHPVDTCHNCGYKGVIYDKCPICRSENILRMRRITGYLTGDLSSWNSAKRAEEHDRVKHG